MSNHPDDRYCGWCDTMIKDEYEEDEDGYQYCSLDCLETMDFEQDIERWYGEYPKF